MAPNANNIAPDESYGIAVLRLLNTNHLSVGETDAEDEESGYILPKEIVLDLAMDGGGKHGGDKTKFSDPSSGEGAVPVSMDRITLGRSKKCTVIINPKSVASGASNTISRRHVEITRDGDSGAFKFRDLGSMNGTFLNDRKCSSSLLAHGDMLQLGGGAGLSDGDVLQDREAGVCYVFQHVKRSVSAATSGSSSSSNDSSSTIIVNAQERPNNVDVKCDRPVHSVFAALSPASLESNIQTALSSSSAQPAKRQKTSSYQMSLHATSAAENVADGTEIPGGQVLREGALSDHSIISTGAAVVDTKSGTKTLLQKVSVAAASVLQKYICCSICSDILLDARLLPCSHAFCRLCYLDSIRNPSIACSDNTSANFNVSANPQKAGNFRKEEKGEHQQAERSCVPIAKKGPTCPVCKTPIPPSWSECGSMHLENLIDVVVESLPESDQAEFLKRRRDAKKRYSQIEDTPKNMLVSPNPPGSYSSKETHQRHLHQISGANVKVGETPVPLVSSLMATDFYGTTLSSIRGEYDSSDHDETGFVEREEAEEELRCEGCNALGHDLESCPHRNSSDDEDVEDDDEESGDF